MRNRRPPQQHQDVEPIIQSTTIRELSHQPIALKSAVKLTRDKSVSSQPQKCRSRHGSSLKPRFYKGMVPSSIYDTCPQLRPRKVTRYKAEIENELTKF
jgi:hypothetical protein